MTTEVTENSKPEEPTFDAIPLSDAVRRAVNEMGWDNPTPVQLETYEPASAGKDLIVQARTGTGKTGAFGIVIADRLVTREPGVQALILAPTRELALQSARELQKIGAHSDIKTTAVYGGAPIERQVRELDDGAQVVSGTPGRVLDHLKRGTLDARNLQVLVLDEADEMLSMGFAEELNAIIDRLPKKRQTLLFSATVDRAIERVASRHMTEPVRIELSSDAVGATTIAHYTYLVTGKGKVNDLIKIMEVEDPESAIIFCNTKAETEMVSQRLTQAGYNSTWLNGDLAQSDREKVMAATRAGKLRFLVATDVAARGIDVSHVTHVMNYTFPPAVEQYIHRTGRTGRAGRTGTAISLVSPQEIGSLYYLRLQYKIFPVERSLPNQGEERTRLETDRVGLLDAAFPEEPSEMDLSIARRLLTHADSERLLGGLIATFFGTAEDAKKVDEQAAVARRGRNPEPVAEDDTKSKAKAKASSDDKKKKKKKRDDDRDKKKKKKKAADPAPAEAAAVAKDAPSDNARAPRSETAKTETAKTKTAKTETAKTKTAKTETAKTETAKTEEPRSTEARSDSGTNGRRDRGSREDAPNGEPSEGRRGRDDDEEGMTRLYVNLGRRDGLRAGDIARILRESCELERADIGRIRVRDKHAFVDILEERVDHVLSTLPGQKVDDREVVVEVAKGT